MIAFLAKFDLQDWGIIVAIIRSIGSLIMSVKTRTFNKKIDAVTRKTQIRLNLYETIENLKTQLTMFEETIQEKPNASEAAKLMEVVAKTKKTIAKTEKLHGCMTCPHFSNDPLFLETGIGTVQECLMDSTHMLDESKHLLEKLTEIEQALVKKTAEQPDGVYKN